MNPIQFVPHILHPTLLLKIDSSCDRKPRLKTDSEPSSEPSLFTRSKRDKPRTTGRHGNSSCSTMPLVWLVMNGLYFYVVL